MPVKLEEEDTLPRMHLIDTFVSNPITEPLLPDDIWHKFELDFWHLPSMTDVLQELPPETPLPRLDDVWAGNHDCMWAGHCGSREHSNDDHRAAASRLIPLPGTSFTRPTAPPPKRDGDHRQSLLKPTVRAAAPVLHTPPMSDDEEGKHSKPTSVLKLLRDAIDDCDLDEEIDLCNYLEGRGDGDVGSLCAVKEELEEDEEEEESEEEDDDDEEEEEEHVEVEVAAETKRPAATSEEIRSYQAAAESDHSYHKGGQNSAMRLAELGLDTPSDSEEEIDVVSVVDKMQFQNKMVFSLPTNPSTRDRQTIQRRMATAISQKRNVAAPPTPSRGGGIKTILPLRKTATRKSSTEVRAPAPATKRRAAEATPARGVKRARQYRNGSHKRRNYGHSSDSEPEPSEKRNLHNNMERQRRIDLRNAFEDLRVLIPEVCKKERAAKVVILREAALFCDHLGNVAKNQVKANADLNRKQDWLRWRVAELRRDLAALR